VLDGAPQDVQVANAWELADSSLAEYRQRGITYIVTSSFVRDARALDADRESRRQDFYTSLDATTTLIMEFRPSTGTVPAFVYDRIYAPFDALWSFDRPGPTIRVYALQRER
jgi:hypothetical protein